MGSEKSVLVSGAGGFVGRHLCTRLEASGFQVRKLSRKPSAPGDFGWSPERSTLDPGALEGCSAVIHLAGENVASGRWSAMRKRRIRASRIEGTRLLSKALAEMEHPPGTFICASAIGFYGDRGEELLDESSHPGRGFLPEIVRDWEEAAAPAREAGLRVVHLRLGVVLHPEGGMLKKILPPFRLGLGGRLGRGRQWMSWIHMEDLTEIFLTCLRDPGLEGIINAVAPEPLSNRDWTAQTAALLGRPAFFHAPAWAIRLFLGTMGEELLLSSTRVSPSRLMAAKFTFRHPRFREALQELLKSAVHQD
ncbi:MAG: TIGR01777 family protein [Planctomycetes bacterium]|nr:TIGR01777 family protein [Planctomycetota bacterium]